MLVRALAERPGLRRAAARSLVSRRLAVVDARACCCVPRPRRLHCRPGRLGLVDLYRGPRRCARPVLRASPSACIICATSTSARAPAAASAKLLPLFCWHPFLAFISACAWSRSSISEDVAPWNRSVLFLGRGWVVGALAVIHTRRSTHQSRVFLYADPGTAVSPKRGFEAGAHLLDSRPV